MDCRDKPGNDTEGNGGRHQTPLPSRKTELMMAELAYGECVSGDRCLPKTSCQAIG